MIAGPTLKLIIKVAELVTSIFVSVLVGKNNKGGKK